jgi:hypothetical protein
MIETNNFQRIGSDHNAGVGRRFEDIARSFFKEQGVYLIQNFSVPVGVGTRKKEHRFDLGSAAPPVLVECKSHTWTSGGNMPSAKMTVWNEAMYYFHVAPREYRKIMFVLKHHRRDVTLANYYLHTRGHLVPDGVEFWEFDTESNIGEKLL